jgi:hypothetical protein
VPYARFDADSLLLSQFDWRTSLSLALASKLVYDTGEAITRAALGPFRLESCTFIEADGTECFVARSAKAVLVSFRGTHQLGDWLANLNVISTRRSYGQVHRGFLGAFQVVEGRLRSELSGIADQPLLLTGHSLGGALATVAAAEWQGTLQVAWIYTYGQPAVGRGDFPAFMREHYGERFVRLVNNDDIVPRVPPAYVHVGRLVHFDAVGGVPQGVEAPRSAETPNAVAEALEPSGGPRMLTETEFDELRAQMLGHRVRIRSAGLESMQGPQLEGFLPSISDHYMDRYIAKIAMRVAP